MWPAVTPEPVDHSIAALRQFAQQLPHIAKSSRNIAEATRLALQAVLDNVTLDDDLDVRTINVEDFLDQFDDATAHQYTVNTRQTYRPASAVGGHTTSRAARLSRSKA